MKKDKSLLSITFQVLVIVLSSVIGSHWVMAQESQQFHSMHEIMDANTQVQNLSDTPTMMEKLEGRLDQEIARAGGRLGAYVSGSQAHAAMQGVPLRIKNEESVSPGGRCPKAAPVKVFDISAINIEITFNRYLDYFPGYLYVLTEDLDKVRAEEMRNAEARKSKDSFPIAGTSIGLQGDLIQPLVIRANAGDCVRIILWNQTHEDHSASGENEPVSFHIHGSSLVVSSTGQPATMANKDALVMPDKSQTFEWYIPLDSPDQAHPFHSHATREQWSLGLSGALIVEPKGSRYLDPWTGKELKRGWTAMIEDPNGPDFREFVIFYHEIGDKAFRTLNKNGEMVPQRGQLTDTYVPGKRALNLRSESHDTRLALQFERHGIHDESMAYSSYTFGDPATPIARSYLGDPVKFRIMGGSENIHSHHLHGGADRWPRSPDAVTRAEFNFAATTDGSGPVKFPAIRTSSDRIDVQAVGATESFTQVIECGSGGCQYGAGDYLLHCHIPQHYVAGMWGFWRVYNTLQTAQSQDDIMPPLAELPDRKGKMKLAVDSSHLIGTTVHWFGGKRFKITPDKTDWKENPPMVSIKDWMDMLLPPYGKPGGTDNESLQVIAQDATVLDWTWDKQTVLNEPETRQAWSYYQSPAPGRRVPIRFDPLTGKLSLPYLRPHLGKRPPFSPDHNPAPFLEPIRLNQKSSRSSEPAKPGENGPWSLCPEKAPKKFYSINAITLPITLKKATSKTPAIIDPDGMLYVLEEEEGAVRAVDDLKNPLVIRTNVYDCVDVLFKSKLKDDKRVANASKVNMHPHLFQFDITGSDGVIAGFNYEQSVRPYTLLKPEDRESNEHGMPLPQNTVLTKSAKKGETSIQIDSATRQISLHGSPFTVPMFQPGTVIGIGLDSVGQFEAKRIKEIKGNEVILTEPLTKDQNAGSVVSVEFVRYRWYPDVDLGIVFWHDHVFGVDSWGHGLFGSTVVEPPGSTYHDPATGKEIRSGLFADIHTTEPISAQVKGSFREVVLHIMDSNPRTAELITAGNPKAGSPSVDGTPSAKYPPHLNKSPMTFLDGSEATTGGGFGMRVEPLSVRLKNNPDSSKLFSSWLHGDPETPVVRAYLGDPIVIRALEASANEIHTWHVSGHGFLAERYNPNAMIRNTIQIGIAERYDLVIPAAGGPQQMAGDYLYYSGRASHFSEGSWGIIRVLDKLDKTLEPLPSHEQIPTSAKSVCPADAPIKTLNVSAIEHVLNFNRRTLQAIKVDLDRKLLLANTQAKIYVLDEEMSKLKSGFLEPRPLALRVNLGDCVKIKLTNRMTHERAGLHADMLAFDPKDSMGINVGNNPGDQTIAPGQSKVYTFYAHPEYGENAALIQDWGNVIQNPRDGLFGVIVIGPKGSKYSDPVTGEDISLKNSWQADVIIDQTIPGNENRSNYRDFTLFFQNEDNVQGTSFMPYATKLAGLTAISFGLSDPLDYSLENQCQVGEIFTCVMSKGNIHTPVLKAHAGDSVVIHVLSGFGEQMGIFTIEGHEWPIDKFQGAHLHSALEFGGSSYIRAELRGGAGGPYQLPGTYVYMNHLVPYIDAGQWGIFQVLPKGDKSIQAVNPGDSMETRSVLTRSSKQ